jgi:hypothetical protein
MARTKRQRKLEARRQRDFQRELERRVAAGEQVVAILGSKTKTTELTGSFRGAARFGLREVAGEGAGAAARATAKVGTLPA